LLHVASHIHLSEDTDLSHRNGFVAN
jgi:hypothetical protein